MVSSITSDGELLAWRLIVFKAPQLLRVSGDHEPDEHLLQMLFAVFCGGKGGLIFAFSFGYTCSGTRSMEASCVLRCAAPGNAPPRVEPVPTPLFGPSGSSRCDPLCIQMLRHGLRKEFGLKMVEDCAQSIGASFRGQPAGAAGQLPATSFYPTKNLGTMGEGGAILTHDPDLGAGVRALRDYGQSAKYLHEFVGYNSRLENCTRLSFARPVCHGSINGRGGAGRLPGPTWKESGTRRYAFLQRRKVPSRAGIFSGVRRGRGSTRFSGAHESVGSDRQHPISGCDPGSVRAGARPIRARRRWLDCAPLLRQRG